MVECKNQDFSKKADGFASRISEIIRITHLFIKLLTSQEQNFLI